MTRPLFLSVLSALACVLLNPAARAQDGELIGEPPVTIYSMANAFYDAWQDVQKFPEHERKIYRYLARPPHYTDKQWVEKVRVLFGHGNQISPESVPYLPGIAAGGNLLRVNLREAGWLKVWDRMLPPHTLTPRLVWQKYKYASGKIDWAKEVQHLPAKWTMVSPSSPEIVDDLYNWTGSYVSVVRADWWLNQSAIQEDRVVGYYDWRGLATRDDFFKQVGFDPKKERRKVEAREAVSISGVGRQPRAIVSEESLGGPFLKTFDFRNAKGPTNPLRIYGRDIEDAFKKAGKGGAASEWLGLGANDWMIMWLEDNEGNRQDSAPDFVGADDTSKSRDFKIHIGLCIRCHTKGMKPIEGYFADSYTPPYLLADISPERAYLLRQHYYQNFKDILAESETKYGRVVKRVTGWDVVTYHKKWSETWMEYEDRRVDIAYAARDLGIADHRLALQKLRTYADIYKHTGGVDPGLSQFISKKGGPILIRQWEEIMPLFYETVTAIEFKEKR